MIKKYKILGCKRGSVKHSFKKGTIVTKDSEELSAEGNVFCNGPNGFGQYVNPTELKEVINVD